ncbi:MAG: LytTR family DNA-binding domain-containing protein [Bacteroidota bacterium]
MLRAVLLGLGGSLFIISFKPFGIQNVQGLWYFNLLVLSMGGVFAGSYFLMEWGMPRLAPRLFERWTLGRTGLWYALVLMVVGGAMFVYKSYLGGYRDFTWQEYLFVTGRTGFIALTVSFAALGIYQYGRKKWKALRELRGTYVLTGSGGHTLRISPDDVLYISSNDNYVDIHYMVSGERKQALFRSSLKQVESQLAGRTSPIRRCHRQHLINTERFTVRNATSRMMRLTLNDHGDELPVSKSYAKAIKRRVSARP